MNVVTGQTTDAAVRKILLESGFILKYRIQIVLILCVLTTQLAFSQTKVGVSVEQIDSLAHTYIITYVPPSTSVYASPVFDDTVFCAAIVGTLLGTRGIVLPMTRIAPRSSELKSDGPAGPVFQSQLVLPDSTFTVRLEICIPTDRVPDGIAEFSVVPDAGDVWKFFEHYKYWKRIKPADVEGRVTRAKTEAWRRLDSIITVVSNYREKTFNGFLTLAMLYGSREGGDSLEHVYLDSAVTAQLHAGTKDPLLENASLWNEFFYPETRNGKMVMQVERSVRTQKLATTYPRTEFGKMWMQRATGFDRLDMQNFWTMIEAWSTSYDVDVLSSIGMRLMIKATPAYDPARAEKFFKRAELSSIEQIGFRTGENIFGSMGRVDHIRSWLIKAYSAQGRFADAIALGEQSMRMAQNAFGRQKISEARIEVALAMGDSVLAERYKHYELPALRDFSYTSINGTEGNLADHKGKVIVLDFWFVGCAGCALEHRSLNEFGTKYKNDPRVVFLSIALNDKRVIDKYLAKSPLKATVVADGQAICDDVGVTGFPTHIILDKSGKTVLWEVGGSEESGEQLGKAVEKLLK